MSSTNAPRRDLPPTPALDALLGRVRARLSAFVALHGVATALAAGAAWLFAAYVLDRWLHLPGPVRLFHLAILLALPAFFLARDLVKPWRRRPDDAGLAVLVERSRPDLRELFVSAVELRAGRASASDAQIAAHVVRDAEARAKDVDAAHVLDARGPRRRALVATAAIALCGIVFVSSPAAARIFFARIAGGSTPWPQRTRIALELSGATLDATPAQGYDVSARMARGSDLAVVVRAQGEVPDEIVLHFDDGRTAIVSASSGGTFRTLLRAVQADLSFHATGGDDQDESPRALVRALQPPDVAEVVLAIVPPAYSGLPVRLERDRDVDVLAGSKVTVHVRTEPAGVRGSARILPEDRLVPLEAAEFPTTGEDGLPSAAVSGYAFTLEPAKSLRYRFELEDTTGLGNPDPALFSIDVVEDKAPEVELLAPSRADVDTVATGLLRIAVRAEDDFGIARVISTTTLAGEGAEPSAPRDLEWRALTPEELALAQREPGASRAKASRPTAIARLRLDVRELVPEGAVLEGQQALLQVSVEDNRAPTPLLGKASPVRVRVVSNDEFMRRVQDRLTRAQASATALLALARDKERRILEIQSVLESDAPEAKSLASDLSAALTGQRRVLGDARALARELAGAAEAVLYARVDDRALAALDFLDARLAQSLARGYDAAPWRELAAASKTQGIAGSGLAGKLVDIVGIASDVAEDASSGAEAALQRAQSATEIARVHAEVQSAAAEQKRAVAKIEELLEKLAEWDNFQSVLGLARDILNGQRTLTERTRQAATDGKPAGDPALDKEK